jgi:phosphoglycerol transferase MdoB-like AlkP superfamily enzyme
MIYARAFGHLISIYAIFAKNHIANLSSSIISLIRWTDFLMLVDLPIFFIIALKLNCKERWGKRVYLFYLSVIPCILIMCFRFVSLENSRHLCYSKNYPLLMSPIGNHFFNIYRYIYEKEDLLDKDEIDAIENWMEHNKKYQEPKEDYNNFKGLIKGKNIIVIQFESLENIMINKSYYGHEITPNINSLLDSSIYFSNIVEQVKEGNSSDAELLFNASIYPMNNGSTFLRFGGNTYVTLPKLLNNQGYESVAIHGDDKEFWNRNEAFTALGFDNYIDKEKFDDKRLSGLGILDESLFNQSIKEIKKLQEPYNIFIITVTSHMPFALEKEMQYLDLQNKDTTSDYLQSIHYTDRVFGEFYKQLNNEGLLENSVLILYGDHEGVHKYYETPLPDNNYEIPFIIHIPGMKGFEIDKIGGQVDMMPTIAYLLGIEKEEYASSVMGRNLFGESSGSAILPTGEVLSGTDDASYLREAFEIANMIIRGNYFKSK